MSNRSRDQGLAQHFAPCQRVDPWAPHIAPLKCCPKCSSQQPLQRNVSLRNMQSRLRNIRAQQCDITVETLTHREPKCKHFPFGRYISKFLKSTESTMRRMSSMLPACWINTFVVHHDRSHDSFMLLDSFQSFLDFLALWNVKKKFSVSSSKTASSLAYHLKFLKAALCFI